MSPPASPTAEPKKVPLAVVVIAILVAAGVACAVIYLNRPPSTPSEAPASPEAKAYLSNLALSDVTMHAAESFMKQRVVEINGKIANKGPRPLQSVDIYCLFYAGDGHEIYRERVPIVRSKRGPLEPGETRAFRLPFDSLPDEWNQAMPKMVIARITFAQ